MSWLPSRRGAPSGTLRGRIIDREALSPPQRQRMWEIFARYYERVERVAFDRDLDAKRQVILLEDRGDGSIQGFCTLVTHDLVTDGRPWRALFTGDTIIERAYWGQNALHRTFFRHLIQQRLERRDVPLYWLLISKGYKTYLIMTRNFPEHWPRHDQPTDPWIAQAMDDACRRLFGEAWRPEEGIIREGEAQPRLRERVAPDEAIDVARHPDAAYFLRANPGHAEGDQLVCLARFDRHQMLHFARRTLRRQLRR